MSNFKQYGKKLSALLMTLVLLAGTVAALPLSASAFAPVEEIESASQATGDALTYTEVTPATTEVYDHEGLSFSGHVFSESAHFVRGVTSGNSYYIGQTGWGVYPFGTAGTLTNIYYYRSNLANAAATVYLDRSKYTDFSQTNLLFGYYSYTAVHEPSTALYVGMKLVSPSDTNWTYFHNIGPSYWDNYGGTFPQYIRNSNGSLTANGGNTYVGVTNISSNQNHNYNGGSTIETATKKLTGTLPPAGTQINFKTYYNIADYSVAKSFWLMNILSINMTVIVVNKSALRTALNTAVATRSIYSAESWANYEAKFNAAVTVLNKATAEQWEIDAAASALNTAISGLEFGDVDYSGVLAAINQAKALNTALYLDMSVVNAAVNAVVYGDQTQVQVDDMEERILKAISKLETKTATTEVFDRDRMWLDAHVGVESAHFVRGVTSGNSYQLGHTTWSAYPYGTSNTLSNIYYYKSTLSNAAATVYLDRSRYTDFSQTNLLFGYRNYVAIHKADTVLGVGMKLVAPNDTNWNYFHNIGDNQWGNYGGTFPQYIRNSNGSLTANGGNTSIGVANVSANQNHNYNSNDGSGIETATKKLTGTLPPAGTQINFKTYYNIADYSLQSSFWLMNSLSINMTVIVVNKAALRAAINSYPFAKSTVPAGNYRYYEEKLTEAVAVLNKANAEQWQIDAATTALQYAIDNINTVWTATFEVNSETHTVRSGYYGDAVVKPVFTPITGYTFTDWTGVPATMLAKHATYNTANSPNNYSVVYKSGTDNGEDITDTETYDTAFTIRAADTFSKTGYTFANWLCSNGTTYAAGTEVSNLATSGSVTMTAQWTVNDYTVVYKAGTGTGDDISVDCTYDVAFDTKPADIYSKTGYTFAGWLCSNGTTYAADTEVSNLAPSGMATLIAQWTANNYSVVYKPGTGVGTDITDTAVYDTPFATRAADTFSKTGYTFAGWLCSNGSTYAAADEISSLATSGLVTMTAQWTANSYTVTYKAGLGVGEDIVVNCTYDTAFTAKPANTYTRTGYTFAGWLGSNDMTYAADEENILNLTAIQGDNVDFVAQWNETSYIVIYKNAGDPDVIGETKRYTDVFELLPANTFSKTGYTFAGWLCSNGTTYAAEESVSQLLDAAEVTFTAQWTANKFYFIYSGNGEDSGTMTRSEFTYDQAAALKDCAFSKTGYSFAYWTENADGSGTQFNENADVKNYLSNGNKTVYAQWNVNTYHINFVTNGGEAVESIPVVYDTEIPEVTAVSSWNESHDFIGWYTDEACTIPYSYTAGQTMGAADITLYADWIHHIFTVTVESHGKGNVSLFVDGEKATLVNNTVEVFANQLVSAVPTALPGYRFAGFIATYADGTSELLANDFNRGFDKHVKIRASFTPLLVNASINVSGGTVFGRTTIVVAVGSVATVVASDKNSFAYWSFDKNGDTVASTLWTYSFVTTEGTVSLYAIDKAADAQPMVDLLSATATKSGAKYRLAYTSAISAPEGYTVKSAGLLFNKLAESAFDENDFVIGGTVEQKQYTATSISAVGQYKITITGVPKNQTASARSYLICENAQGETVTVYSDIAYIVAGQ